MKQEEFDKIEKLKLSLLEMASNNELNPNTRREFIDMYNTLRYLPVECVDPTTKSAYPEDSYEKDVVWSSIGEIASWSDNKTTSIVFESDGFVKDTSLTFHGKWDGGPYDQVRVTVYRYPPTRD